jgi:hypothetical protein
MWSIKTEVLASARPHRTSDLHTSNTINQLQPPLFPPNPGCSVSDNSSQGLKFRPLGSMVLVPNREVALVNSLVPHAISCALPAPSGVKTLLVLTISFQPLSYLFCSRMLFPLPFLLLSPPLLPSTASFFLLQILLFMLTAELLFVPLLQLPPPSDCITSTWSQRRRSRCHLPWPTYFHQCYSIT